MSDRGVVRVGFVCVQNAGRSQMAAAFARRERERRGLEDCVELVTGGTAPADRIHDVVVKAMLEAGIDISNRTPREVTGEELRGTDYVVTMGCDAEAVCPAGFGGENRDWGLDDPDGLALDATQEIRDEIRHRVGTLFDELEAELGGQTA